MFGGDNKDTGAPADNNNQPAVDNNAGIDDQQQAVPDQPYSAPQDLPAPAPHTDSVVADDVLPNDHSGHDDLLNLKQQALQQLSPLVSHLDQSPEEKFRTTMMMIQASDNSALLKDAYEAAQSITDEKVKAQALLDVINEINYFTQQHDEQ